MQTTINERIQMIIDRFFSSNATKLANSANIPLPTISSIVGKRKNVPSSVNLSKIYKVTCTLGVSSHWLLTGEGEMIKKTENTNSNCLDLIMEKDKIIMEKDKMIMGLLKLL